jgi:signal peptidase II
MAAIGTMLLVAFDQLIKYLVVIKLKGNSPYVLISGVFQLEYLENRGAAFGILQNQRVFFYICAALIALVVLYFYHRVPMESRFLPLRLCAVFIISGAIGNVIDRIRLNYVVDFLYFKLIDFPIFNVADIYVTLSAIALILLLCVYYKEEDLERIFHRAG